MNIECVESITIEYGGFFGGTEKRVITHDGDRIVVGRTFYNGASDDGRLLYAGKTWTDLLHSLDSLHIDDWAEQYDDPDVLDGTQWSLDIAYSKETEGAHYWGSNKYPDNFDEFMRSKRIVYHLNNTLCNSGATNNYNRLKVMCFFFEIFSLFTG